MTKYIIYADGIFSAEMEVSAETEKLAVKKVIESLKKYAIEFDLQSIAVTKKNLVDCNPQGKVLK